MISLYSIKHRSMRSKGLLMAGLKEIVGKNIARLLRDSPKEVTQAALAHAVGRSPAAVNKWIKGTAAPDTESLERLADFFNIEAYQLLVADGTARPRTAPKDIRKDPKMTADEALRALAKHHGFVLKKASKPHG